MGKKAKKTTTQVDVDEEDEEPVAKGGKKGKKKTQNNYWDEEFEKDAQAEEDKSPPEEPSNGSKSTKKGKTATFFQVEEDDDDEEDSPPVVVKGSKKGKKATEDEKDTPKTAAAGKKDKKAPSRVVEEDEEGEEAASKSAKGGKKGKKGASQVVEEDKQEDAPWPVAAKGGKKGKKKQDNYWDGEFEEDVNDVKPAKDEDNDVQEEEEKETSKKKQSNGSKPKNETQGKKSEEITKNENSEKSNGAKGKGQGKSDDKATGKKSNKLVELIKKQQEEKRIAAEEAERRRKEEEAEEAQRIAEEEEAEKAAQQKKKREPKEPKDPSKQTTKQVAPKGKTAADARFLESLRERGLLPAEKSVAHENVPKKTNKSEEISGSAPAVAVPVAEPPRVVPKESETVSTPAPVVATPTETITEAADDGDWEDWENRDIEEIVKEPAKPTTKPEQPGPVPTPSAKPNDKEPPKPDQTKEKPLKKEKGNKKGVKPTEEEEEEAVKPKEFRTPICCILGHVDTGKTSLLDRIRHTNVQEGEAGGITQQIGATYFPISTLQEQTASLAEQFNNLAVKVPGLLIIDTPGHESFTNLRSRGSGLCDIAILVVDIMHGLEPQTIESINLLRMRKTPFVVALNKVDRIYGWKAIQNSPFRESLKHQTKNAALEFDNRVKEAIAAFAGQELNAVLYYRNKDFRNYVSLVPTSAHSGEGIPDLLMLLVQLTQRMMGDRLYFSPEIQCTVLEVKVTEGHGTTIDVVLVNGVLHEGDTIVLSGMQGPIVTQVRALLTPQPLRELRVKGTYIHHKEIKAAMGIKIVAQDLEKAVAGSALFVAETEDDIDDLKKEVQSDFDSVLKSIDSSTRGVCVQASTLGSLEALLTFLKASKIPVSGVALGPIHRRDVMRASVMLEHNPQYAVILAFDVKVEKDAQIFADEQGVKIFTADIIYHLFDKFTKYIDEFKEKKRAEASAKVVWPCVVRIKPNCVFNKKDPIVLGVEVIDGRLKIGTPLCVPSKEVKSTDHKAQ